MKRIIYLLFAVQTTVICEVVCQEQYEFVDVHAVESRKDESSIAPCVVFNQYSCDPSPSSAMPFHYTIRPVYTHDQKQSTQLEQRIQKACADAYRQRYDHLYFLHQKYMQLMPQDFCNVSVEIDPYGRSIAIPFPLAQLGSPLAAYYQFLVQQEEQWQAKEDIAKEITRINSLDPQKFFVTHKHPRQVNLVYQKRRDDNTSLWDRLTHWTGIQRSDFLTTRDTLYENIALDSSYLNELLAEQKEAVLQCTREGNTDAADRHYLRGCALSALMGTKNPLFYRATYSIGGIATRCAEVGLRAETYMTVDGCEFQHVLHHEFLSIMHQLCAPNIEVAVVRPIYELAHSGVSINRQGYLYDACRVADWCWRMVQEFGGAVCEGVIAGIENTWHTITHPRQTIQALSSTLRTMAVAVVEAQLAASYLELYGHPREDNPAPAAAPLLRTLERMNMIEAYIAHFCRTSSLRDIVKHLAQLTTQTILLNWLGQCGAQKLPALSQVIADDIVKSGIVHDKIRKIVNTVCTRTRLANLMSALQAHVVRILGDYYHISKRITTDLFKDVVRWAKQYITEANVTAAAEEIEATRTVVTQQFIPAQKVSALDTPTASVIPTRNDVVGWTEYSDSPTFKGNGFYKLHKHTIHPKGYVTTILAPDEAVIERLARTYNIEKGLIQHISQR